MKGSFRKGRPWEGKLFCYGVADAVFTFKDGKITSATPVKK